VIVRSGYAFVSKNESSKGYLKALEPRTSLFTG
jgi:hypothetical protein